MNDSLLLYCCFCAESKESEEIIDLKLNQSIRKEIIEKLTIFNTNMIEFDSETLLQTICNQCSDSLNVAYTFFIKFLKSQIALSNLLYRDFKSESSMENNENTHNNVPSKSLEVKDDKNLKNCEEFLTNIENDQIFVNNFEVPKYFCWDTCPCVCKLCGLKLQGLNSLRDHSKFYHNTCISLKCKDCNLDFKMYSLYINHMKGHFKSLINICEFCNIKFEDNEHTKIHTSKPYCNYCGETFPNKKTKRSHIKVYGPSKNRRKPEKLKEEQISEELIEKKTLNLKSNNHYDKVIRPKLFIEETSSNEVSKDIDIKSWDDYPCICRYCNKKFWNQTLLRDHSKEVHGKCFAMACVDCDKGEYNSFSTFVDHVLCHRPDLKSYCPYCNYKFDNDNNIHIVSHKNLHCTACGETFCDTDSLNKHLAVYKPVKPKREKHSLTQEELTCKTCGKITKSANYLKEHLKTHSERKRDFFCERCGMSFYTKGALKAHLLIHENPNPEICMICKKSFISLSRLKKHVLTHSNEKPFECCDCKKRFRVKAHLKSHMATHLDVTPFSCQYCGKQFKFKNVLKVHERQHTGTRPYSCDFCKMEFFNWSNCDKHLRRKHGTTLAKSKITPQGKIPINPKSFKPKSLEFDGVKEWTEQLMVPRKRGRKVNLIQT